MKKVKVIVGVGALVVLGACSPGNNFRDVEGVPSKNPDAIVVYNNVDQHPNIAKVCIEGVAFATTTRDLDALTRVPEWDRTCPGGVSR